MKEIHGVRVELASANTLAHRCPSIEVALVHLGERALAEKVTKSHLVLRQAVSLIELHIRDDILVLPVEAIIGLVITGGAPARQWFAGDLANSQELG